MSKNIYIAIIGLLVVVGCRDSFDMDDLHEETKLVLNCFPSSEDTTWIDVSRSIPVTHHSANSQHDSHLEVKGARIIYKVNGQQRTVGRKDAIYNEQQEVCVPTRYYVTGPHQTGDRVEIEASAEGYAPVSAQTVVGEAVPITLNSIVETRVYDPDDEQSRNVYQLSATFTDPAATQDYYAVRVRCKHYRGTAVGDLRPDFANYELYDNDEWRHVDWTMNNEWEYEGTCSSWGEVYDFHLQLDSAYSHPEVLTMSEPLLQPLGGMDSDFGYDNDFYQYFYVFSDATIKGQTYTLRLNLSPYHKSSKLDDYSFRPVSYQVQFYHLTPEVYHYARSINDVDNNELAEGGFSMIHPTYSNVRGGIGVVGGYGYSESGWMMLDNNQ